MQYSKYLVICVGSILAQARHATRTLYGVHCTAYIVRRTLYGVHCTAYIVRRTLYGVHCTAYIVRRTLYGVQIAHDNTT